MKYLKYLAELNPKKDYYLGSLMNIGSQHFAYGGSGSIMSQGTMRNLVKHLQAKSSQLQELTSKQWAGDCVLGTAIEQTGVSVLAAGFEMIRDSVTELPLGAWCRASVSFHHMSPEQAISFQSFEEKWFSDVSFYIKIRSTKSDIIVASWSHTQA